MAAWTEDEDALLRTLLADRVSCSIIGSRIGRSRNAVIGRAHRLHIASGHAPTTRRPGSVGSWVGRPRKRGNRNGPDSRRDAQLALVNARRKLRGDPPFTSLAEHIAEQERAKADLAALLAAPDIIVPLDERKQLPELADDSCRWIFGDPQTRDHHFCNGKKVPGLPYCKHHCARAYQPPQPPSYLPNAHMNKVPTMNGLLRSLAEFDAMETA